MPSSTLSTPIAIAIVLCIRYTAPLRSFHGRRREDPAEYIVSRLQHCGWWLVLTLLLVQACRMTAAGAGAPQSPAVRCARGGAALRFYLRDGSTLDLVEG